MLVCDCYACPVFAFSGRLLLHQEMNGADDMEEFEEQPTCKRRPLSPETTLRLGPEMGNQRSARKVQRQPTAGPGIRLPEGAPPRICREGGFVAPPQCGSTAH